MSADPELAVALDAAAARDFAVGRRCLLRLRLEGARLEAPITGLDLEVQLSGVSLGTFHLPGLAEGSPELVTLAFSPSEPGHHELDAIVTARSEKGQLRGRFRVHLRVLGEAGSVVNVVTIDQSQARVVDNSRSTFGMASGPQAGVLEAAEWHPLALVERASSPLVEASRVAPTPASAVREALALGARRFVDFEVLTSQGRYLAREVLARGDLATLFLARRSGRPEDGETLDPSGSTVLLKIAADRADNDLLLNEAKVLERLASSESAAKRHLPRLLDQFRTSEGRVGNVLERLDGIDLLELRQRLPDGLPPRHLVWVLRRALTALTLAHSRGVLHGNLDPSHILVRAHDHMLWLVDWCYGIIDPALTGDRFKARNEDMSPPEVADGKPPIPASDLYSLGKCMIFLAGGDVRAKTLPEMPEPLERLIRFMTVESPRGRAQDALELYREVDRVRERVWGPHTFVPLIV